MNNTRGEAQKKQCRSNFHRCGSNPLLTDSGLKERMVPAEGFEPPTPRLRSGCSTAELRRRHGHDPEKCVPVFEPDHAPTKTAPLITAGERNGKQCRFPTPVAAKRG